MTCYKVVSWRQLQADDKVTAVTAIAPGGEQVARENYSTRQRRPPIRRSIIMNRLMKLR